MNLIRFNPRNSHALDRSIKKALIYIAIGLCSASFAQGEEPGSLSGTVADADYGGTVLDVPLYNDSLDVFELESFSVKAQVLEQSDIGLIAKRQKAPAISDAIGAESFSRLGLGNAADALSKVTGASIEDGKYVIVRGLSDRYNNMTLNGSNLPSADPNRKSVQLDQFPTGLLDVIETTKTFTPDKSGEFTGGSIDIQTKAFPDQSFYNASIGFSYNENTTDKPFLTYPGGSRDWLGKDDGARELPESLKDAGNLSQLTNEEQSVILNDLSPVISPQLIDEAPLNQSFSFAFGDSIMLSKDGDRRLGYMASITHSRSFKSRRNAPERRYQFDRGVDGSVLVPRYDISVDESENNVNLGGLFNISLQLSSDSEIGLKNFYNQSGSDESIMQTGANFSSEDLFLRESRIHFTERSIQSNQLYGKHMVTGLGDATFEWDYSKTKSAQSEPDYVLFFDGLDLDDFEAVGGDFDALDPSDWKFPTGFTNRRLYRDLEETGDEYGFDVELPNFFGDNDGSYLKFGYRNMKSDRSYAQSSFGWDDGDHFFDYSGDRDHFLSSDNIDVDGNGETALVMSNLTDAFPEYSGVRDIAAFYAMVDSPFAEKWRFIGGLRHEDTSIEVTSLSARPQYIPDAVSNISESHLLPSANFVYALRENQNLRFAYTQTVARPSFREVTPAAEFDSIGSFLIVGNADLKMTEISNYDLRWELFPEDSGELIAVSVFFKELENPIEQVIDDVGFISWDNVQTGKVQGVELEARKKIKRLSSEFTAFTVGGNYALIDSEVDRSQLEIDRKLTEFPDLSPTRDLQGQSASILNLDVSWEHFRNGTSATLAFNHTGERLYAVTNSNLPLVDEKPADTFDLIASQRFGDSWKLKFKVSNLLDSQTERFHAYEGEEFMYSLSEYGRTFSLSLSYDK